MIDLKILKETPEKVRENLQKRNMLDRFPFDELIGLELKRRELITKNQKLKERRNTISTEIAQKKKQNDEISELLTRMKSESNQISEIDRELSQVEKRFLELAKRLPNFLDARVPIGKDETSNVEISRWGDTPLFPEDLPDHMDIALDFDLVDTERAARTSGARFYFLKRDLARLNYAMISAGLDFLTKRDFIPVQPPYMLKGEMIGGSIIFSDFEEVIYKIQDEDLYLIGTAEHALASMHAAEIFDSSMLPLKYAGVSPCFRKEAGAHGKDTKGIFRVHQFEKVEQFAFCRPDESASMLDILVKNSDEFMKSLGIPHRAVILSSGDMGKVPSITVDIEAWMPSQKRFREIISCSNCTDFQSRSLGIKFRPKEHEESEFVHTLNGTLVAEERTMVAILENYYRKDARIIEIPKLLQPYMDGIEVIHPVVKLAGA